MLLRLKTNMAGPSGCWPAGARAEFPDETARELIAGGFAEPAIPAPGQGPVGEGPSAGAADAGKAPAEEAEEKAAEVPAPAAQDAPAAVPAGRKTVTRKPARS